MGGVSIARFLVFKVDELTCAVPVHRVREVLPALPVTRIPGAASPVSGMVSVRGELVTLLDARTALQQNAGTDRYSIVLLESDRCRFALAVDEVVDMVSVGEDDFSPRAALPGVRSPFVSGIGVHHEVSFAVLDIDVLSTAVMPSEEVV